MVVDVGNNGDESGDVPFGIRHRTPADNSGGAVLHGATHDTTPLPHGHLRQVVENVVPDACAVVGYGTQDACTVVFQMMKETFGKADCFDVAGQCVMFGA